MKANTLICGLVLVLFSGSAQAAPPPSLEQVVNKIQQQYEKMQDLEADFVQESYNKTLQKAQKAGGKLYMKKPGLMHWDYQNPEEQIIVADGKYFWWYTVQTKQVVRQKADQALSSNLAMAFMGGMGKMQKDFKIEFASPPQQGKGFELKLVPARPQASVSHLLLTVDAVHYRTRRLVLQDFYGNITTLNFSQIKINQGLDETLFQFIPPPGVELITPQDFPGGRLH